MTATTPLVVVCDNPQDLPGAARTMTEAGWAVRTGFTLPGEPWDLASRRWACQGTVGNDGDAVAATWALVRGCGLIVAVSPGASPDFLGDLGRAGQLERFTLTRGDDSGLDADETALLAALAHGLSMQQAAKQLHLSGRTAQRRLASARATLGVRTTREAVMAWTRLSRPTRANSASAENDLYFANHHQERRAPT